MEIDKADFQIDELRLDKEWLQQSNTHFRYAEHAAVCTKQHDEAKARLEVVRSQCDQMLRKNPAKYGLNKATEKAIELKIPSLQIYQEAQQEVIDARFELEMARAALYSIDSKKRSLEKLVDLFLSNYFSEPKLRHDADQADAAKLEARVLRRRRRQKPQE